MVKKKGEENVTSFTIDKILNKDEDTNEKSNEGNIYEYIYNINLFKLNLN